MAGGDLHPGRGRPLRGAVRPVRGRRPGQGYVPKRIRLRSARGDPRAALGAHHGDHARRRELDVRSEGRRVSLRSDPRGGVRPRSVPRRSSSDGRVLRPLMRASPRCSRAGSGCRSRSVRSAWSAARRCLAGGRTGPSRPEPTRNPTDPRCPPDPLPGGAWSHASRPVAPESGGRGLGVVPDVPGPAGRHGRLLRLAPALPARDRGAGARDRLGAGAHRRRVVADHPRPRSPSGARLPDGRRGAALVPGGLLPLRPGGRFRAEISRSIPRSSCSLPWPSR